MVIVEAIANAIHSINADFISTMCVSVYLYFNNFTTLYTLIVYVFVCLCIVQDFFEKKWGKGEIASHQVWGGNGRYRRHSVAKTKKQKSVFLSLHKT
jgi:hypothetical protein